MCTTTPRVERNLPLDTTAPRIAREFLREAGCTDHAGQVLEPAVLLVSEVVTNAVLHGGPPLVIAVDCDGVTLQVRVRDGNPDLPARQQVELLDERGRGIELLELLSNEWGAEREPDGKTVWFHLHGAA